MDRKKIPLRRCIICGGRSPKRDLTRIVASPSGQVSMDLVGKSPGRGAYLCGDAGKHRKGVQRSRVEHALRIRMSEAEWRELSSHLQPTDREDDELPYAERAVTHD